MKVSDFTVCFGGCSRSTVDEVSMREILQLRLYKEVIQLKIFSTLIQCFCGQNMS